MLKVIMISILFAGGSHVQADSTSSSRSAEPMTLDECIAWARLRHPKLAEAGFQIDESRGLALQSGLYPNPRIDSGNPQTIGPKRTTVLTTGLTQEIVTAGKLNLDHAAATSVSRQAEWNQMRIRYQVLTEVRQAFFSTLAAQRRHALVENLLRLAEQSEKTSTNLLRAEQVNETDLLLARVERRRAELATEVVGISLLARKQQLATTMGAKDLKIESVEGSLLVPVRAFDFDAIVTEILEHNPEVQMALRDIDRARYVLRRAEVEPIPNITVQGGFQYSYDSDNAQGIIGTYFDIPIWNRNQGSILAANAATGRATANRDAVRLELLKQVVIAVERYQTAATTIDSLESGILPDAMRSLALVGASYARGQVDITRLLQTQRSVFECNLDYVSALENRLNAAAEIAGLLQLEDFP